MRGEIAGGEAPRDPSDAWRIVVERQHGRPAIGTASLGDVTLFGAGGGASARRSPAASQRAFLLPGYGQIWGMRSGSGLVLGSGDRLAVAETDTANDLSEAVGAVQSAPVALG
jgi:hypothetical protein